MQSLVYYEIYEWDGGDRHIPSGIAFSDKEEAMLYKGQKGANVNWVRKEIIIVDSIADVSLAKDESARLQALKKLTPKEIQLLGISHE